MKLIASLIATAALSLSALVAVPTAANAAPYPGSVATASDYAVPRMIKKGHKLGVAYRVRAAGNARPSGILKIRVYKIKNRHLHFNRGYNVRYTAPAGRRFTFRSLGKFKSRGAYATRIYFAPGRGSVYKPSASGWKIFHVTKKHR